MATISDSIVDYFHLYNSDGHAGKGVSERATGRLQYHWVFNNEFEKNTNWELGHYTGTVVPRKLPKFA